MEEFTPLFWVLLTVAAMVYSGVSKARKQASKAAKQVPVPVDEAWPRMDDTEPDQEVPSDSEGSGTGSAGPRALAATGSDSSGSRASAGMGSESAPTASNPTSWASGTSTTSAFGGSEAGEAAYTGEAQSLEEIPDDVFRPGADYEADYGTRLKPAYKAAYKAAYVPQKATQAHSKAADQAAEKTAGGDEIGSENADDMLGEEFDLRKAVIYSEILKPKFEE